VVRVRAPQEREPAAERAATGGRGVGSLVGGQAASTIGDACYAVALPWYVLTGHGGAAALGTTLVAYGVARAAAMPAGGLLCDRLGARRVLLTVDVLRAVLIGGLAVQVTLRPPSLVTLALFSALAGACQGTFVRRSRIEDVAYRYIYGESVAVAEEALAFELLAEVCRWPIKS
jgi:MFS family permease